MLLKAYDGYYTAIPTHESHKHEYSWYTAKLQTYTRILDGEKYYSRTLGYSSNPIKLCCKEYWRKYKLTPYPLPLTFILRYSNNADVKLINARLSQQLWNAQQCLFNDDVCSTIIARVVLMLEAR